jgi:hypothetical protein
MAKKRWQKNQQQCRTGGLKRAAGSKNIFKIEDCSRIGVIAGGSQGEEEIKS